MHLSHAFSVNNEQLKEIFAIVQRTCDLFKYTILSVHKSLMSLSTSLRAFTSISDNSASVLHKDREMWVNVIDTSSVIAELGTAGWVPSNLYRLSQI